MNIGVKELLEAGVHFGHQTRRWNPAMKRFIFDARNGIHILDLGQTMTQLQAACEAIRKVAAKGGRILFVGTKKQAQGAIKDTATECGQFFITERWLGGTLTNLKTIRNSISRLKQIEQMDADGSIKDYGKKEQAALHREAARMFKNLDGIRDMEQFPDAMFVVDIKREHNAIAEARKLRIPIFAIVDTNCDPDLIDTPIPGNDDAIRSIRLILGAVGEAAKAGRDEYRAKYGRSSSKVAPVASEAPAAEAAAPAEATPAPEPAPAPEA